VRVKNPNAQAATLGGAFEYDPLPMPTITSIIPDRGPLAGNTRVDISNEIFYRTAAVRDAARRANKAFFLRSGHFHLALLVDTDNTAMRRDLVDGATSIILKLLAGRTLVEKLPQNTMRVDFGTIPAGMTKALPIIVKNTRAALVFVVSIVPDFPTGMFTVTDQKAGVIDPGKTLKVCKVTFSPSSAGEFGGTLVVSATVNEPLFVVHVVGKAT
jgi:hypothetical protein